MAKQNTTPVVRAQDVGTVALIDFKRMIAFLIANTTATVIHQKVAGVASEAGPTSAPAVPFSGIQNDIPRTLLVMDNGIGVGNSGNLVVTGIDQFGNVIVETIAILNGGLRESRNAFTYISKILFPAIVDTNVEVQQGDGIGIPAEIRDASVLALSFGTAGAKAFVDPTEVDIDAEYDVVWYMPGGVQHVSTATDIFEFYVQG